MSQLLIFCSLCRSCFSTMSLEESGSDGRKGSTSSTSSSSSGTASSKVHTRWHYAQYTTILLLLILNKTLCYHLLDILCARPVEGTESKGGHRQCCSCQKQQQEMIITLALYLFVFCVSLNWQGQSIFHRQIYKILHLAHIY